MHTAGDCGAFRCQSSTASELAITQAYPTNKYAYRLTTKNTQAKCRHRQRAILADVSSSWPHRWREENALRCIWGHVLLLYLYRTNTSVLPHEPCFASMDVKTHTIMTKVANCAQMRSMFSKPLSCFFTIHPTYVIHHAVEKHDIADAKNGALWHRLNTRI